MDTKTISRLREIFSKHLSDKGLVSTVYYEPSKLNATQIIQLIMGKRHGEVFHQKGYTDDK